MAQGPSRGELPIPFLLSALALAALAASFGVRFWRFAAAPDLPALLDGLPESKTDADQELFRDRLRTRFSTGVRDQDDLIGTLRGDGFTVKPDERTATYDRAAGLNDLCRRGANIHWTLDANGALASVSGGYYVRCPQH